jgi:hypothetical protein
MYTPPLMKKVIGKYVGTDELYIDAKFGIY